MKFPFFWIKPKPENQTGSGGPALELETGAATDPGRKRGGEPNQDGMLILPAESARPLLLIVADGMGGYAGGAEASRLVIDAAASWFKKKKKYSDPASLLKDCILQAHRDLVKHAKGKSEQMSMGSTLVLAAADGGQVFVANVGDSRAYILHGEDIPVELRSFRGGGSGARRPDDSPAGAAESASKPAFAIDHAETEIDRALRHPGRVFGRRHPPALHRWTVGRGDRADHADGGAGDEAPGGGG